jgi:uncharacterized protein YlxW (UPF0749 family)
MSDPTRPDEAVPERTADPTAPVPPADAEPAEPEPTAGERAATEPVSPSGVAPEPQVDLQTDTSVEATGEPDPQSGPAVDTAPAPVPAPAEPSGRRSDRLAAALIGVLTLILGFAFAVQVRAVGDDQQYAGAREEDLVRILDDLDAREERLREQLTDQRIALQELGSSDSQSAAALKEARRRSEAIGILNGTIPARGEGLRMTIQDPEEEVRVADLLDTIQELRGAGAETMQIDDVRVGVSTAVTGRPGDLEVDGRPITAPYEILVIGSPENMETAMNIPGGVVQHIGSRGGKVTITRSPDVIVDALRPLDTPQYASPATDD